MFGSTFLWRPPIAIPSTPRHLFPSSPPPLSIPTLPIRSQFPLHRRRPIAYAATNGDGDGDKEIDQAREDENGKSKSGPGRSNINWVSLVLDPDPDNVIAVGLTGLLTWASVSVLWQLFTISLAILVAALKYSFIAALLIFILITLL